MMLTFVTFYKRVFAKQCSCTANRKASSKSWKASFKEVEGFLRRELGFYSHKFLKHAVSLMDLLECHLYLQRTWHSSETGSVILKMQTMHIILFPRQKRGGVYAN